MHINFILKNDAEFFDKKNREEWDKYGDNFSFNEIYIDYESECTIHKSSSTHVHVHIHIYIEFKLKFINKFRLKISYKKFY